MTNRSSKPGFFRAALQSMIEGRQRQAERYVNQALLSLDDKTLSEYGVTRQELTAKERSIAISYL